MMFFRYVMSQIPPCECYHNRMPSRTEAKRLSSSGFMGSRCWQSGSLAKALLIQLTKATFSSSKQTHNHTHIYSRTVLDYTFKVLVFYLRFFFCKLLSTSLNSEGMNVFLLQFSGRLSFFTNEVFLYKYIKCIDNYKCSLYFFYFYMMDF